jgi:hypothetical protein
MVANDDLFYKTVTSFKYHYCHPDERLRPGARRGRSFVCGWQFYSYDVTRSETLDELDETAYPVCEKCRQGYYLWIVAE